MNNANFAYCSNQNSLIFQYPFLMSSIKKAQQQQTSESYQRQSAHEINLQQRFATSRSPTPQNLTHETFSQEKDINDDSSIEFCDDDEQELDDSIQNEIQQLENQITFKLNQQYNLLREKLKIKSQERQHVLKTFRELSTLQTLNIEPLQEMYLQDNIQHQNLSSKPPIKIQKNNPLNTKNIKNKIIRDIQQSENIQTLKTQRRTTFDLQPPTYQSSSSNINNPYTTLNCTFKIQNLTSKNHQTPQLLKSIKHKQVKSITKIDNSSDDLIRQMSQELKNMEFRKVQDIARGKFTFLRKK